MVDRKGVNFKVKQKISTRHRYPVQGESNCRRRVLNLLVTSRIVYSESFMREIWMIFFGSKNMCLISTSDESLVVVVENIDDYGQEC